MEFEIGTSTGLFRYTARVSICFKRQYVTSTTETRCCFSRLTVFVTALFVTTVKSRI